ncbi:hypothetical protein [Sinorhizobium meliloti]|uniref:hypothetical protein n=1 Tax=Rhizobium meliloti TaxID=382 RepID=UPI000FD8FF12|nr:hypothetical protein [Sinorhizobium meliloti]RVO54952.1 hypothetical protein CN092_18055 [Sinorhizobium meliloti]
MPSLKELLAQHKVEKSDALEAFLKDIKSLKTMISAGEATERTRRVRLDGSRYTIDLLGEKLEINGKDEALKVLDDIKSAGRDSADTETQELIEKHYSKPKRPGRPRGKGKGKKAVVTGNDNGIDRSID